MKLNKRNLIHIPIGFFIGIASFINVVFTLSFVLIFTVYEVNEDWHLNDEAWEDLKGVLIGMVIGGIIGYIVY